MSKKSKILVKPPGPVPPVPEPDPREDAEPDPDEPIKGTLASLRKTLDHSDRPEEPDPDDGNTTYLDEKGLSIEPPFADGKDHDNIVSTDLTVHEERKTGGHYFVTLKFYIVFDNGMGLATDDPAYYTYSKVYYAKFSFGNEGEIAKTFVDHINENRVETGE